MVSIGNNLKLKRASLAQESKRFVDAFPDMSSVLADESIDPDLNRTIDALTYLYTVLEAKLELEHEQLSASLINMFLPNYVQTTPSMLVIECVNTANKASLIAKGTEVYSVCAQNKQRYTFQIARDTYASPFTIGDVVKTQSKQLSISFKALAPNSLCDALSNITFYCGAELYAGFYLYLYFLEYAASASVVVNNHEYELHNIKFSSDVFSARQAILLYPNNIFSGHRLLHEYFCYPQGFLFFNLDNLNGISALKDIFVDEFELKVTFKYDLPPEVHITRELLKINCTPAINLFAQDFDPIALDGKKTEYPLIIRHNNNQHNKHYEFFKVTDVTGYLGNKTRHYAQFENFHHEVERAKGRASLYYHINMQPDYANNDITCSISFMRSDEALCIGKEEIISVSGLCSNNNCARHVKTGARFYFADFSADCSDGIVPPNIELINASHPSVAIAPNLNSAKQFATISALSFNYLSLLTKESLQQLLQNYNFVALYSERAAKKLELLVQGIASFATAWHTHLYQDITIFGQKSTIHLENNAFYNNGEMYLFGCILANFYAQCAPVNSFHFLDVVNLANKEVYSWQLLSN